VHYVVPNGNVGGGRVAIRCNVYTHNGEQEPFTRQDVMMNNPTATISNYTGLWKYLQLNNQSAGVSGCDVSVTVDVGSIIIGGCQLTGCNTASVLTPYGESKAVIVLADVGLPYTQSVPRGSYIVAFRNLSGSVLCTKLVYVP